jgi:hypothetical protein
VASLFKHAADTRRQLVENTIFATDYRYASGRIDVIERGDTVRSCRSVHDPQAQRRWIRCSVEELTYVADAGTGRLERADGSSILAVPASEPRDIPDWLLCPVLAPIWGSPGQHWRADTAALQSHGNRIRMPLRSAAQTGFAEIVWPDRYLSQLSLGDELYVVRELDWQPAQPTG